MNHLCRLVFLDGALTWLALLTALATGCSQTEEAPQQAAPAAEQSSTPTPEVAAPAEPEEPETKTRPAFASPAPAADGRPPHPAIPAPLEEREPPPAMRGSTSFRWLPGHWIWTGNQYVWQAGVWIYDVPGHTLVPARWVWDGEYWGFEDAGWAAAGSTRISFRPTALPGGRADVTPEPDLQAPDVDLYVAPSSYAVYVWTGTWLAPPIAYPAEGAWVDTSRYPLRTKSANPDLDSTVPTEPSAGQVISAGSPSPTAEAGTDEEDAELIPGVLHGGKRGEEELRLMEEAAKSEAEEEGVDSVYVPYNTDPYYYYRRYPSRPRPPARPRPLPAPSTPVHPR